MAIRRNGTRPASNFTIVSNDFARDSRLSFKAKGVGLYILTHAETFTLTVASIARAGACGESLVKAALRELEDCGYLVRERQRNAAGQLADMDYLMSDAPEATEAVPPAEKPAVENPPVENPTVENRGTKKTNSKNTNPKKLNPSGGGTATAAPAALFDVAQDEPKKLDTDRAKATGTNPAGIVAVFVDSYREAHRGASPLVGDIRKVAGQAKRILGDPAVAPELLLVAAQELGRTSFTDLGTQYRRVSARPASGVFSPSGDLRRGVTMVASSATYQPDDAFAALAAEQDAINARMSAAVQFPPSRDLEV